MSANTDLKKLKLYLPHLILLGLGLFVSMVLWNYRQGVPAEGDLGCFMGIASHMHQGAWLYDTVWDNKAPGIFILHYIGQIFSNSPNYPIYITIAFLWLCFGSVVFLLPKSNRYFYVLITAVCAYFLGEWLLFWELSFIGGFTEELGMLSLVTAAIWFLMGKNDTQRIISGLFLGLAIFIKEPFALFVPAFWFAGAYRGLWNPKRIIQWHLLVAVPWLFFILIYWASGRIEFIQEYLEGAFLYAGEGTATWDEFAKRWTHIQGFTNPMVQAYGGTWIWMLRVFMLRFIWLVYRKLRHKEYYTVGSWYMMAAFALLAGSVFLALGAHAYLHYGMPFIAVYFFVVQLTIYDLIQLLKGPMWEPLRVLIFTSLVLFWGYPYYKSRMDAKPLQNNCAQNEKVEIKSKIPKGSTVFVDAEYLGRYYGYLNVKSSLRYPVPYYTFFYNPSDNQREDLVYHRMRFREEFLSNPPNYILSKEAALKAPIFDFTRLKDFVNNHFELIDSAQTADNSFLYIRRMK